MKFKAPAGVTALFCAGDTIAPDESGLFDAVESLADELAAHGCVLYVDSGPAAPEKSAESRSLGNRARVEKAI